MKEIKKVAFLGLGALGAAYISKFMNANEFETVAVADGRRYDRLKANGLDSENTIAAVYGVDPVLYAISIGIDALREQNRVKSFRSARSVLSGVGH